ncbi:hypothetical protein [Pseudomonas sp. NFIX28]|jgi:hypothetical protein|uniref:hypothetical protein n=1 Tax=Pseudomonas sp. NFIX28 TaxID=1566235 RepID=UPI0008965921|nr:hypothetical protein [Pseudomonas sp. NFIX28]SDZ46897.1 hypothetical protein SAMN03159453_04019 [Pseudomonas sp. NFIX28]
MFYRRTAEWFHQPIAPLSTGKTRQSRYLSLPPAYRLRENARLFPIRFIQLDLDNPQEISDAKPS